MDSLPSFSSTNPRTTPKSSWRVPPILPRRFAIKSRASSSAKYLTSILTPILSQCVANQRGPSARTRLLASPSKRVVTILLSFRDTGSRNITFPLRANPQYIVVTLSQLSVMICLHTSHNHTFKGLDALSIIERHSSTVLLLPYHIIPQDADAADFDFDGVAGEHVAVGALGAHPDDVAGA